MENVGIIEIFLLIYLLIWISLLIEIVLFKHGNKFSIKMHEVFIKRQIQKFQYPPFKNLLKLWIANKFFLASVTFISIIIIPAVVFFFLLGIILISPVLAVIQGFTVGNIIGDFKTKEMIWALTVGLFEFGYWALSGALGVSVSLGYLLYEKSFLVSLSNCINDLSSVYWLPLAICIVFNAFGEVAGPIYLNIKSPVSLEMLSQGKY